jgi:hypothetical protein
MKHQKAEITARPTNSKFDNLRDAEKMLRGVYHAKAETTLIVSSLLIGS